jgi:hypothetical protein
MALLYKRVLQAWSWDCVGVLLQLQLRLQHNSLLSYALTWRPACLWTEAWHSVADLAGLLAAIACQRQPMTFAQNSICNNLLEKSVDIYR